MPELPEVEVMVRDLRPRLVGRTIVDSEAAFPGAVKWPNYEELRQRIAGETILQIERRGKYALFHVRSGDLLAIHRGMSGSLLHRQPGDPMESHVRLLFALDDGSQLRFNDPRKFGKVYLLDPEQSERPLPWARMGPEPLNGDFSLRKFRRSLAGRTGLIKPLLLNQGFLAGMGNIYVDEALHLARIHPKRRADTLRSVEIKRLHDAIPRVLHLGIEERGTTFRSYVDVDGKGGNHKESLTVYGRNDAACLRCGTPIQKIVVGGRGTHFCPRCQKL